MDIGRLVLYGVALFATGVIFFLTFFYQYVRAIRSPLKDRHNPKHADYVAPTEPLAASATAFHKAMLPNGDIDVYAFQRAYAAFVAEVLDRIDDLGVRVHAQGMHNHEEKLQSALVAFELRKGMPAGRSLRSLFFWEKGLKIHSPGGIIADESAAAAVLWLRFGLQTWLNFFTLCGASNKDGVEAGPLAEQAIEASHGDVLGFWSRTLVSFVARRMGRWDAFAQSIGGSVAETEKDAKRWCAQVQEVILTLKALQREFDYEDKRASV